MLGGAYIVQSLGRHGGDLLLAYRLGRVHLVVGFSALAIGLQLASVYRALQLLSDLAALGCSLEDRAPRLQYWGDHFLNQQPQALQAGVAVVGQVADSLGKQGLVPVHQLPASIDGVVAQPGLSQGGCLVWLQFLLAPHLPARLAQVLLDFIDDVQHHKPQLVDRLLALAHSILAAH